MNVTVDTLKKFKRNQEKFTCITAYDACFTKIINDAGIETILIGDSLGMVLQGQKTTLSVTVDHICYHTESVSRANKNSLIIADMPFMSHLDIPTALINAAKIMRAGAHMVKLEGTAASLCHIVTALVQNGIPVCAHIGLLPQSVNTTGGYKIKGRTQEEADQLVADAEALEMAGSQVILMECVLSSVAQRVDKAVSVPTIGIGAGPSTTAQVLVLHDLLGLYPKAPKFSKNFLTDTASVQEAITAYHTAVKAGTFPTHEHSFTE